ncbi:hypothetical protein BSKO_04816 [Bryopsis sp. KO-2023]|nr:hypothetical protein BSKO_04816 [Bryopsis sp. KO-2023]
MVMPARPNPLEGNKRFTKIKELGSGHFGFVLLAHDNQSGEKVAIKFLLRGMSINRNVEREIINHRRLYHHHIIEFRGIFLTKEYLGIVLEYAEGGDLLAWIKSRKFLKESQARWLFQQLIMGLDYIHRQGVVNRDIKLENTLVTEGDMPMLKLCDFGYSKNVQESAAKSLVGTRLYLAPEVISSSAGEKYDGVKADIWSTGVFLYIMLLGFPPFGKPGPDGKEVPMDEAIRRIAAVEYEIPEGVLSPECEDLIRKILVREPTDRPSIKDIQQHVWYQTELPDGALEYNDSVMDIANRSDEEGENGGLGAGEGGVQGLNEIRGILRRAASLAE